MRQVLDAVEAGCEFEAILSTPADSGSERAWQIIDVAGQRGVDVVQLSPAEFERISSRDNPVGLAATIRWRPEDLRFIDPIATGIYIATDDVRIQGISGRSSGRLMPSARAGVIVHSGTDPGHPSTSGPASVPVFKVPVHTAPTFNELFYWAQSNSVAVYGSSAKADPVLAGSGLSRFPSCSCSETRPRAGGSHGRPLRRFARSRCPDRQPAERRCRGGNSSTRYDAGSTRRMVAEEPRPGGSKPSASGPFRRYYGASALSSAGRALQMTIFGFIVFEETESNFLLGLFSFMQMAPCLSSHRLSE
ncbi:MAG: hypothetical protein R2849_05395 [Thermomicrobiales bacterium]